MKRFLSIVLVLLMMIPFSALSVLAVDDVVLMADEETPAGECTVDKQNIANEASVGYSGNNFWALNETLINDGNKGVVAHSPQSPAFSWHLKFGKPYEITNIDLYVNGSGMCYKCGTEHSASEANSVKSVQITLYDDLGNEVYKSDIMDLREYDGEGQLVEILEEAKFEFPKVSVASVTIDAKTDSWGSAYFREVEVYKETGAHNWILDEDSSVPSTCTSNGKNFYDCECGASKQERTNKHTVEEWTVTQAPTTTQTGMAEGPCVVPGCGGTGSKALDRLILSDTEIPLTLNNFTVTEDVKTGDDTVTIQAPNENRDWQDLFDGVIETATWGPSNFWCGTGWYSSELSVDDDLIGEVIAYDVKNGDTLVVAKNTVVDADVVAKLKEAGKNTVAVVDENYSTLTITLDQVYTLTMFELYVYSNNNSFSVDFIGEDGSVLKTINKSGFEVSKFTRLIFTGDIYSMDVKEVVLRIHSAKWEGGVGLSFTEILIGAHECAFSDEDIASGTTDGCVTTFAGKCTRCQVQRSAAKVVTHNFEKDPDDSSKDKETVVTEVTCFSNGIVTKHCTVCDKDIMQVVVATGEHVYDKEVVVTEPNCGVMGVSYNVCSTQGCPAKTEEFATPTKGNHNFKWVEKEDAKADYTHEGVKVYRCEVCEQIDEAQGTQVSPLLDAKLVSSQDWTIRYTDFVSARANFKISLSKVKDLEKQGYIVSIYGVVQKGEVTKQVKIYGEGVTGTYKSNGSFALVVKNASPADEFKFSVLTVIESSDEAFAETTTVSKAIAGNNDGTVCVYDVAKYYINNDSRANRLESNFGTEVKNFYASLVEQAG